MFFKKIFLNLLKEGTETFLPSYYKLKETICDLLVLVKQASEVSESNV